MSLPNRRRTVTVICRASKIRINSAIASRLLFSYERSLTALSGIRFTWHNIPESKSASCRAHSGVSFSPWIIEYSNEMRRPVFSKISKTALADIEPLVRCILETALYQIFEMDRVPDSAACNEATELVKKLCPGSYAGFVNAILRNTVRKKAALRAELQTLPGLSGTSVRHSIPLWICQKWEFDYGQGSAEQIAHGFESIPPHLTLHINTLKITADEYLAKLDASLCPRKIGESLITLSGSAPVESLPGFEEGLFFIQDESSALCAALVSASVAGISAPTVIDTCACPGGKTFAIAIANRDRGTLYSFDLHANRLSLIERGTNRLGISSVRTQARNARQPDNSLFFNSYSVL